MPTKERRAHEAKKGAEASAKRHAIRQGDRLIVESVVKFHLALAEVV